MKTLKKFVYTFFITSLGFIVLMELCYRFQVFDYYKAELNQLNPGLTHPSSKKKILLCGDSFSADPASYVTVLRDSLKEYQIINSSIPGSGILQHAFMLPGRIKKYKPEIFIYQFYIGNDLFDLSHPYHSAGISLLRKIYWFLSDHILCLSFLNFRLAGFRYHYFDDAGGAYSGKNIDSFTIDTYSKREKFIYKAEPSIIENSLFLENGRSRDWESFKKKFSEILLHLNDTIPKYFVLIPHESMLSAALKKKHVQLGAIFNHDTINEYPLVLEIKQFCAVHHITLIDFTHPPVDSRLYPTLFYSNDPHLSLFGQQILGQQVLNEMKVHK